MMRWADGGRPGAAAVQLLAPLVVSILLYGVQLMADAVLARDDAHPPATPVPRLPRCDTPGCTTVLYGPAGVPWAGMGGAPSAHLLHSHTHVHITTCIHSCIHERERLDENTAGERIECTQQRNG